MASNRVPDAQAIRLRLANSELGGISNLGVQIGLSVVTAPVMNGKIADFNVADTAASAANTDKSAKQGVLNAATNDAMALAGVIKRYLTDEPGFGTAPNAQWQELGFPAGSLQIERKAIETLMTQMSAFLLAHPAMENQSRGVTGDFCLDKRDYIIQSRSQLDAAKADYSAKKGVEDAAFKSLGETMSQLVKELKLHLGNDDARWYAFGLRRPDDPETPPQPHNLLLSSGGEGRVFCDWDDVPGASRYHVWLAQGEQKAARVASVEDSEFMLQDLMVGTTVKIYIVAANEGGDSVPSDAVMVSVV